MVQSQQDGNWITLMAGVPNAASVPEALPLVTVMNIPAGLSSHDPSVDVSMVAQERDEFISRIRSNIANNQSVLIRKWYPEQRCGFSVEDIGMICPFMQQEVDFQGLILDNVRETYSQRK